MNIADVLPLLVETTIAGSVAIVIVLLFRKQLRARFGARIGYASWWLVPAALVAVLLPAATVAMVMPAALPMNAVVSGAAGGALALTDLVTVAIWVWLAGVLFALARFALQQHRFRNGLGVLQTRGDGLRQATATRGLPVVFGLVRPQIVVPADFDLRFSAEQKMLMQAHERSHIRAGDLHGNAVVVALRCLFWFNPLVHVASRHFRHDQELACDQRVIAQYPKSRRAYGEAMLKAQLATRSLPLGCHWGCGHPLKERIAMLNQPAPTRTRRIIGGTAVSALTLVVACAAWAAQPPQTAEKPVSTPGETTPAPHSDVALPPPAETGLPVLSPPRYPQAAIDQKITGKVVLVIDVDASGNPVEVAVESSEPAGVFDQAAIDAASKWKFNPEIESGKPVASRVRVPVDFDIPPGEENVDAPAGTI